MPVVIVAGPTASGKSALALELADALGGTIINADSLQIYRDLRILTRAAGRGREAPGAAPALRLSRCGRARLGRRAGASWRWPRSPRRIRRGRLPILVGGTGLYLRALAAGLAPVPEIPAAIRARGGRASCRARRRRVPRAAGATRSGSGRPAPARRQAAADPRLRGGARHRRADRRLAAARRKPDRAYRFATILLAPPREALYAACDAPLSLR